MTAKAVCSFVADRFEVTDTPHVMASRADRKYP